MWSRSAPSGPVEITVRVPELADLVPRPQSARHAAHAAHRPQVEGLSPLAGRVLDQLSVTAWLPAALVVANVYVVAGLYLVREPGDAPSVHNLSKVVAALNEKPIGIVLAVVFGVVLVTLVTQSLEYAAIRFLEGYWGGSLVAAVPTRIGVWIQVSRIRLLDRRAARLERDAILAGERRVRINLRHRPELAEAVLRWAREGDLRVVPPELHESVQDYVHQGTWLSWAPAHLRHRIGSLYVRREAIPSRRSRMLPTRLGNALRSAEDELSGDARGGRMRGYLYGHLDCIGPGLMRQHDQYRNRLDMCAVMTIVAALLAAADAWLLRGVLPLGAVVVTSCALAVLAYLSYRGAVAAALDYGPVLLAMDREMQHCEP